MSKIQEPVLAQNPENLDVPASQPVIEQEKVENREATTEEGAEPENDSDFDNENEDEDEDEDEVDWESYSPVTSPDRPRGIKETYIALKLILTIFELFVASDHKKSN